MASWKIGLFGEKKNQICDYTQFNRMPYTNIITEVAPHVRIFFDLPSNVSTIVHRGKKVTQK